MASPASVERRGTGICLRPADRRLLALALPLGCAAAGGTGRERFGNTPTCECGSRLAAEFQRGVCLDRRTGEAERGLHQVRAETGSNAAVAKNAGAPRLRALLSEY